MNTRKNSARVSRFINANRLALLCLCAAPSLQAISISTASCTVSANPQLTNLVPTGTATAVCPQFNPALGSLVYYNIWYLPNFPDVFGTANLTNALPTDALVRVSLEATWYATLIPAGSRFQGQPTLLNGSMFLPGNGSADVQVQYHSCPN